MYGGPAAEITDYWIVMRGSAGLTPWDGEVQDIVGGDSSDAGIPGVEATLN